MTTRTPSAASATAIEAPMPLLEPATRARRPAKQSCMRESSHYKLRHLRQKCPLGQDLLAPYAEQACLPGSCLCRRAAPAIFRLTVTRYIITLSASSVVVTVRSIGGRRSGGSMSSGASAASIDPATAVDPRGWELISSLLLGTQGEVNNYEIYRELHALGDDFLTPNGTHIVIV